MWGNVPVHHTASTATGTVSNHEGAITGPKSYDKSIAEAVNEEGWEFENVQSRDDRDKIVLYVLLMFFYSQIGRYRN